MLQAREAATPAKLQARKTQWCHKSVQILCNILVRAAAESLAATRWRAMGARSESEARG